jgi:hypothetical protein
VITDAQIEALKRSPRTHGVSAEHEARVVADCKRALFDTRLGYGSKHERRILECEQRAARARCAEILNARENGKVE